MPPKAHITHRMARRTRLRIPARRGDGAYFEQLTNRLGGIEGVEGVTANPFTGSVLIHHDDNERLVEQVLALRLFEIVPREAEEMNPNLTLQLAGKLKDADDRVRAMTAGRLDLNATMVLALLAGAGFQIFRGDLLPAAGSLLWYAFGLAWLRPPRTPPHHID